MGNGLLLGFIALYLLGTLLVDWWASRRVKTTSDFVMAGRGLPKMFSPQYGPAILLLLCTLP